MSPPPELIADERSKHEGEPLLHAFVVGVSRHARLPESNEPGDPETFELRQLSATAGTAVEIVRFLKEANGRLPVALGTIRVLLSPTREEEQAAREVGADGVPLPTVDAFLAAAKDWRDDAATHEENHTLFYFAGHGLQRSSENELLVLHDFGEGPGGRLRKSVTTGSLLGGMAPTAGFPHIARRQLYFVDACRERPDAFAGYETMQATDVFDREEPGVDDRATPQYYAAVPGERARAQPGKTTIFGDALLECLRGAAGTRDGIEVGWHVSVGSLARALKIVEKEKQRLDRRIKFDPRGAQGDPTMTVVQLEGVPDVAVTLRVDPRQMAERIAISVRNGFGDPVAVPSPLDPNPFRCRWPAGAYRINADVEPDGPSIPGEYRDVLPPSWRYPLEVAP
jgi:Caspase domain